MPQAQPLQPHPEPRATDFHRCPLRQPLLQLGQRPIRLLPEGAPQLLLHRRRQPAGWTMPGLPPPLLPPRPQLLGANLLAVSPTDAELLGPTPASSPARPRTLPAAVRFVGGSPLSPCADKDPRILGLRSETLSPVIEPASTQPRALSFMNLLECHMLASMTL